MKYALIVAVLFAATPVSAQEVDTRTLLKLEDGQRNHVLTEMRALLTAVQGITVGLAKDDMAAVAESAQAVGFNMKHKAENTLHKVLPHEFMMLGMSMHKDFDSIAADAIAKKDAKLTLKQLGDVLAKCSACHATYQIRPDDSDRVGTTVSAARLDEIAERGRQVMPFDLKQTTHVFNKTATGGIQQVVAKNPADTSQIKLIRQHLSTIAAQFSKGDFSIPARIHGQNMPGMARLSQAKSGELTIVYTELNDGGQIEFTSAKPEVVDAVHQYCDAQLKDHARHAIAGHGHHPAH